MGASIASEVEELATVARRVPNIKVLQNNIAGEKSGYRHVIECIGSNVEQKR